MSPRSSSHPRRCRHPLLLSLVLPALLLLPLLATGPLAAQTSSQLSAEATVTDPRCPAQDAAGEGPCDLFLGYRWDGQRCESLSGCDCVGADCGDLFPTITECQRAFCRCACEPQDAEATGLCEAILGWAWDGARCHQLVGCSCVGEDCGELFASESECLFHHEACPCVRQDVSPVGLCEVILGYFWDGGSCEPLVGCSCSGPDCEELFGSQAACEKSFRKCRCRAQDARGEGLCALLLGYRWNGESCEAVSGCSCVGRDCDLLAGSLAECQAVHDDCPCRAMDATGSGPCALLLGWKWDGSQCVGISGCDCVGSDCDDLFSTQSACAKAHSSCLCRPQDARVEGPCDQFFGYRWDGISCVSETGCECLGGDCDELFATATECRSAHLRCPCREMDATGVGGCALFHGWKWDGTQCVGVSGCTCEGEDCDSLFQDLDACRKAHSDCDPCCGCNTCKPALTVSSTAAGL